MTTGLQTVHFPLDMLHDLLASLTRSDIINPCTCMPDIKFIVVTLHRGQSDEWFPSTLSLLKPSTSRTVNREVGLNVLNGLSLYW